MSRDLRREIIGCLRVAGSVEGHLRSLRNFPKRDWEASVNWLNLSGIALAFWDRLQKLGAEDVVPRQVGAGLAANLADHRLRVAAMRQEFDSLNREFEQRGIEYAALKGFTLIPEYCPDACLRPAYDYDYLISEEGWGRADEVLEAAGYARKPESGAEHSVTFAPSKFPARLSLLQSCLYGASLPRRVELHRRLWDEDAFRIPLKVPEHPLHRKLRRTWQGISFFTLGEEDAFMFQTLHVFQHILHNWCRLRWLLEIAFFLETRSANVLFWKKLYANLEDNEPLREVVALVVLLAGAVFHAPLPAAIKEQSPGAMRGRVSLWVERYGLRSALDNFSENKYALFLYREFIRDEGVWRQVRNIRLLPLHRPNRVAGAVAPPPLARLPASWKQAWYVAHRLIHHAVSGAGYVWESARWEYLRRLSAERESPAG